MAKLEVADSRLLTLTAELPPGAAAAGLAVPGEPPEIDPARASAPGAGRLGGLSPKIHLRTLSSISIGSFGRLEFDQSRGFYGVSDNELGGLKGARGARSLARTHLSTSSLGIQRSPSTFLKNFGSGADCPAASLCLTSPLCLSSTAVLAAVAPCMSADLMASVNLDHNLITRSAR